MSKFEPDYLDRLYKQAADRRHRTIVALVGLGAKQCIPPLHARLHRCSSLQSIIWCYKNCDTAVDVLAKKQKVAEDDEPMLKWIKVHDPEYIPYREGGRILGRTCDMLILQDFEALTPNMAVTCMETVRGGGLIVLLLDREKSLSQLISRPTDLHTELGRNVDCIFNRRFFKLLVRAECCVFLDQKIKVMDITPKMELDPPAGAADMHGPSTMAVCSPSLDNDILVSDSAAKLALAGLLRLCKTADQRSVLESCMQTIDSNERAVVPITASRGRGKSASLGLAAAYAAHSGMSSILVSALHIENVQTLFDFAVTGLLNLGYQKIRDFKVVYSFSGKKRGVSQIYFPKTRQSIRYHHPLEGLKEHPAMLIVDEAASVPLNYLKELLAVGLVFMASTVGGYEGTGRAFKLKLDEYLSTDANGGFRAPRSGAGLELQEPIRYAVGDPVEKWLNAVLFLDASVRPLRENPLPSDCKLYYINKPGLFCGNTETEHILSELFALFAAAHYRNSPNDLQILADACNHEVFALLSPGGRILCALQIAFEGLLEKTAAAKEGNLIPWVINENFHDEAFLRALGARVVRIAVHPHVFSAGYGSAALSSLTAALRNGKEPVAAGTQGKGFIDTGSASVIFNLIESVLFPKAEWVGSSFGLTEKLHGFWRKNGFLPVGIKQAASKATGCYSAIVLRGLRGHGEDAPGVAMDARIEGMCNAFTARFVPLLGYSFRLFSPSLSLALIHSLPRRAVLRQVGFSQDELCRLRMFAKGAVSAESIMDALPRVAQRFFLGQDIQRLGVLHQSVLLMLGCQFRTLRCACEELGLEDFQLTAVLAKAIEVVVADAASEPPQ